MGPLRKFKKERPPSPLQRKRNAAGAPRPALRPRAALLRILSFAGFAVLVVLIAFAGLTQSDPRISQDQVARERVVADFGFTFESEILTQRQVALARERIPPSYTIDKAPFERFARAVTALEFDFAEFEESLADLKGDNRRDAIEAFVREYCAENGLELPVEPTAAFLDETSAAQRNRLLQDALAALGEIYRNGIVAGDDPNFSGVGSFNLIPVETGGGEVSRIEIQRTYDAKVSLRNELAALETSDRIFDALYGMLGAGIRPNLRFDPEKTRERRDAAAIKVDPVKVEVEEGSTIIEPGMPVTPLAYEKLVRYRQEQSARAAGRFFLDPTFQQRTLLTVMILVAAALLLHLASPGLADDPRKLGTIALLVLANLAIFRTVLYLGNSEIFGGDHRILSALPYAAPIAFGPITAGILLGPVAGALTGFLVAALFAVMLGEAAFLFVAGLTASLVGIFFCHNIRLRTNVVRASFLAGVTISVFILLHGALLATGPAAMGRQIAAALISASVTGVAILGLLPLLEKLFNYTTDITLLEYTDFNHPLLRRMQLEAPGTYHHSLMVASLSENAAAEIGANSLACRATALFHDIGKLVKPEYFTENQSSGRNPLVEQKPSMSAVIIKRHVKEGVELARKHKLPRIFVDIIRQHHGTSLIQYFYQEAINRRDRSQIPLFRDLSAESVEEDTYRYDGPKPRFVESAIIFLADSVEAASRSLPKVNAQSVNELLDRIFQIRIEDGQLDESPLTLRQVAAIKKSFSRTLLNSLHARVAYPAADRGNAEKESPRGNGAKNGGKSPPPGTAHDDETDDPDRQQV